ncbi:ATPase H(+)-transporting accessory protein 2 [Cydia fagiglandana]|uniref:ATPase H(+)-transporting accessory protein 2 n=1 Tax=Cydia fagiglandana TaxID=1458189 RepID=UPI002FEDF140
MAVKMVVFWCSLVLFIVGSNAAGEFDVIHSPKSLSFFGSSKIPESLLKEVFSAALGLSVEEGTEWDGMTILDPFTLPEAVVEVYVDGVPSLGETIESKSNAFPLTVDEYEPDTFEAVRHRIQQRYSNGRSRLLKIKLTDVNQLSSGVFADVKVPKVLKLSLSHLKYSVEEDSAFLNELAALKAITEKINSGIVSGDNIVDFYNFRFQSLHDLSDFHGPNSLQVKEAKKLLGSAISELSSAFAKAYDGAVLVAAVATDVAHTRRTVRAAAAPGAPAQQQRSLSTEDSYSEDYSAIFNIILWFGLVFAFSLVAIVYAIMDMDPGRDSIIYRMTSTRMKKDN